MAYGRRDGFSYSDGIPIKLSERVKIPPRVTLPISFQPSISQDLLEDYDFSLEYRVLQYCEDRRRVKENQEKEKSEKIAREIEQFARTSSVTSSENNATNDTPNVIKDSKTLEDVPKSWQPTHILSPEPLVSKEKNGSNDGISSVKKPINLEDFESQSGSPFDFVELQTINEIEELSNVFQGIQLKPTEKSDQHTDYPPSDNTRPSYSIIETKNSGFTSSFDNSSLTNGGVRMNDLAENFASNSIGYHTATNEVYPVNVSQTYLPYVSVPSSITKNYPQLNDSVYSQYYSMSATPLSMDLTGELPRLRSSKSTPDISVERDDTIAVRAKASLSLRSQTPPPNTIAQASITPTVSGYRFTNAGSYSSSTSTKLKESLYRIKQKSTDYLPDPFDELEDEQRQFVSSLKDMGFPRDRAARAVKHLGMDDKKVVDHLCQVQSFVENGCDGIDAETALHLYDYNTDEAKKFLDFLVQFQDLGFNKDAARKALIRHKNNREKALDSLLS